LLIWVGKWAGKEWEMISESDEMRVRNRVPKAEREKTEAGKHVMGRL